MKRLTLHSMPVIAILLASDVIAQEVRDATTPESVPVELRTWQMGRCEWRGRVENGTMYDANGRCAAVSVWAREVSRDGLTAKDVVVFGPKGVVSGPDADWDQDVVRVHDGHLQTTTWAMNAVQIELSLDTAAIRLTSPRPGRMRT